MFIAPITAEVRTTCPYCGVGCGVLVSPGATGQPHAATLPWRGRVGSPLGDPGWGDSDAAFAEALSPPPGPLKRADLPPAEPHCSEGSATQQSDRSRQQPTSVGGGDAIALPRAEVKGDPAHPANAGRLCSKGSALGETLGTERRLLVPEIWGRRASWDEALDLAAAKFSAAIEQHGPESVAMYVSGQFLTEDYYVANKLMKGFFGAANIDTNSRLCMASSVAGHIRAFGEDVVPGCYADIDEADLAVSEAIDRKFIADHSRGFDAAVAAACACAPSIPAVAELTGVDPARIAEFYALFTQTARVITLYSQGVNQSSAGTDKVNAIINCHLATGRIGRPG